jgi:probable phosphoglycerate mutase
MSVFHLIRHAEHGLLGRELVGRKPDVRLSEVGRCQAERLADRLQAFAVDAVLSSPRERALETAEPIAARHRRSIDIVPALDEVDFGQWTGRRFDELNDDARWRSFNRHRADISIPGGELLVEVQARVIRLVEILREQQPEGGFVLVTHGDVIRAALLHWLGMPLDFIHRLEIGPASRSSLRVEGGEWRVLVLNEQVASRD